MTEAEPSRPGSVLRAEREALGVTLREVSETLNLSMTVIDAIESDDHDRLPGPVFARGYVRAYARLLELDPEPLLTQVPQAAESRLVVGETSEAPYWEWIRQRPGLVLGSAGALLVLVLVLLVLALWPEDAPDSSQSATGAGAQGELGAPARLGEDDRSSLAAPESRQQQDEPSTMTAPPRDGDQAPFDEAPTALARSDPPADRGQGASDGTLRRITGSGDDRLSFAFTDDCWVEVRDTAGTRLYSDLGRSGSSLELVGQGPFRILLGYAPGAQLGFNGESVPLAPHTRDNVATIVLGQ